MREPSAVAEAAWKVVPGVWHWSIHDERIDTISAGHAICEGDEVVLVDPVRLADDALKTLGGVTAICLTSGSHERSAWRYRDQFDAPLYAPWNARRLAREPDERYREGDRLPGRLHAVAAPGPGHTQHALLLEREPGVLFCPDHLLRPPGGGLQFVPARYMVDAAEARRSVERLLELDFSVLCLSHGEPLVDDPKGTIRELLEREPPQAAS